MTSSCHGKGCWGLIKWPTFAHDLLKCIFFNENTFGYPFSNVFPESPDVRRSLYTTHTTILMTHLDKWPNSCHVSWWRHQMETFSALLAIYAGNKPVAGEFPALRPVTRSFDVFFNLRLNNRLSKESWGWWFEMLSRPLWRHRNVYHNYSPRPRSVSAWNPWKLPFRYHLGPLLLTCINFSPNMDK